MTAIGSNFSACASACCSQNPKCPVQNRIPLPCAQREPHALFAFPIHQRQLLLPG